MMIVQDLKESILGLNLDINFSNDFDYHYTINDNEAVNKKWERIIH